jgi:hypothetical protein
MQRQLEINQFTTAANSSPMPEIFDLDSSPKACFLAQ